MPIVVRSELKGDFHNQRIIQTLPADLRQNRPSLRRRIGRVRDRPPDHDVACSRGDRLRRSDDALLITHAAACRPHARSHDGEIVPQFCAQTSKLRELT